MADFELHISSYSGLVPGAVHYRGRVCGEHPRSCHGGTTYHGAEGPLQGKTTCSEGHELPKRIEWDVEAPWDEARYKRWAARHFEGVGPGQFSTEEEVIEAAVRRFLGHDPPRWWEEEPHVGQPGDKLYLGHRALHPDGVDGKWGTVIAEAPAAKAAS